jgi:hypothetical protein
VIGVGHNQLDGTRHRIDANKVDTTWLIECRVGSKSIDDFGHPTRTGRPSTGHRSHSFGEQIDLAHFVAVLLQDKQVGCVERLGADHPDGLVKSGHSAHRIQPTHRRGHARVCTCQCGRGHCGQIDSPQPPASKFRHKHGVFKCSSFHAKRKTRGLIEIRVGTHAVYHTHARVGVEAKHCGN